jgi:hypothetical protein
MSDVFITAKAAAVHLPEGWLQRELTDVRIGTARFIPER